MILITKGHDYVYEVQSIVDIFLPGEKIIHKEKLENGDGGNSLFTGVSFDSQLDRYAVEVALEYAGKSYSETKVIDSNSKEDVEFGFAHLMYDIFHDITGIIPQWGLLTGIRPVKLAQKKLRAGWTDEQVLEYFENEMLVQPQKAKLMLDTAKQGGKAFDLLLDKSFSLYVGIPFCPSRCSYCSFVSHSIERTAKLIPDYVEKLCEEIAYTAQRTKNAQMILTTVYVGGGTPTSLTAEQLERVLMCINQSFDMSHVLEYTVEAGRADTITREKLEVIKQCGASRISINPQTFSDSVLQAIGRKHTVEQVYESYRLARELGFDDINMDLIAGLDTESIESFKHSVNCAIELSPENITVHTLAVKRSSDRAISGQNVYDVHTGLASVMMDYVYEVMENSGYSPYYLYRQRNMRDNLENVGFGKNGKMGLYNIYIMEEVQSIIACGAGAVSKLYKQSTGKIERIFNYKFPYEYLNGFDVMLERKNIISSDKI